jgi:hypothetical protein
MKVLRFIGMKTPTLWFLGVLLANVLEFSAQAQPSFVATNLLREDFWDTDGTINAIVAGNGVVYVGGSFSYVAPKGRKVAAADAYTGEPGAEFPAIVGTAVHAILNDGNGGWWIGGNFTSVGGLPRTNLVHLGTDFTVDPEFHPNPDGAVRALAKSDDVLYVGGDFTSLNGHARSRLAAFDIATSDLTDWNPGADLPVQVLFVSGDTVYVGGLFHQIGNIPQRYLAAVDAHSGSVFTSFAPQLDAEVLAMDRLDDRLYLGGNFNRAGVGEGAARNGLAAVHAITGNSFNWNPNPIGLTNLNGGKATAVRVSCNTVYVGGYFTNVAGVERHRVAALDADSGDATSWDAKLGLFRSANLASSILTLELAGDVLYLGGDFNSVAGQNRSDLIAVDSRNGELLTWNPGFDGGVNVIAVAGRTLLAGFVTGPGGQDRLNLAALNETTGRVTDWNPQANGTVFALALSGNTVFAGGNFTEAGGEPHHRLAAIDALTGEVRSNWAPDASDAVRALAVHAGTVYAGGSFTTINGAIMRRIAALDANSGMLRSNWSATNADSTVHTLAVSSDTLFVGGSFGTIGSSNRMRLAALELATGRPKPWFASLDASGTARALALSGNTLYIGGSFVAANQSPRTNLAAVAADSGALLPWNPPNSDRGDVRALQAVGELIYVGGTFASISGQPRFGLGAVSADGIVQPWNPGTSAANQVLALALSERSLLAGGLRGLAFDSASSLQALAAFPRTGAPRILQPPASVRLPVNAAATFTVDADGLPPLTFQWQHNDVALALDGATNATLLLTNLNPAQSGRYTVVVSNALGVATAEATLIVQAPAAIQIPPAGQTVAPGTTLTLSVEATGNPPPLYQWRLNGVNIPGAVYPTLTLSNVSPASGGTYSVAVANSSGVDYSADARVLVTSPLLLFADNFANRGLLTNASGVGSGSTAGFSNEALEPRHAGKAGGHSAWLEWIAPSNGIVTFSTRGSGFDTLLAIYTNATLATLGSVTSDDDRGGFLTSRTAFNALRGVHYQIAVDGLGGEVGDVVLAWETEVNAPELPMITAQPLPQSVTAGSPVIFSVGTLASAALTFQWFVGCQELRGATNATLVIANAQYRHVGLYHVLVTSANGRSSDSLLAALELGPSPGARSYNKLADLLEAYGGDNGGGTGGGFRPAAGSAAAPFLISLGAMSHRFTTDGSGTYLASPCGPIIGAGAWLYFTQAVDGVVVMDTLGSDFNTLLTVYRYTNFSALNANVVACDDDGAPDNVNSWLHFDGTNRNRYLAIVSGVRGEHGQAQLNWRIVPAPLIVDSDTSLAAPLGGGLVLDSGVRTTNQEPVFQWFLNGVAIAGATNRMLQLFHLRTEQFGTYQILVRNDAGSVTNTRATLRLRQPLQLLSSGWVPPGRFSFTIQGESNTPFSLEAAPHLSSYSNLQSWTLLQSGRLAGASMLFTDTNAAVPSRFYRVMEWPRLTP